MILWICFAILTAVVVGALLWPLLRTSRLDAGNDGAAFDLAVYQDQLLEIERDRERGVIEAAAASSARAELARRIFLHTERDDVGAGAPSGNAGGGMSRALLYGLGVLIPVVSAGMYLFVGSPGMPGYSLPIIAKTNSTQTDIDKLVAQVEERLRDKPLDGAGWDVIAPVYFRLEMFEDARIAFAKALELLGPSKARLSGLGRSAIRASGGEVTDEAREAFTQFLVLDPKDIESRLWLARAKEQDGDTAGAIAAFEEMLASSPKDAKWRPLVEKQIATMRGEAEGGAAGPSPADVSAMSGAERAAFITKMVERLAARVAKDGSNFEEWVRLVRGYAVLERTDDAKKALADARKRFGADSDHARSLEALARKFKLGS